MRPGPDYHGDGKESPAGLTGYIDNTAMNSGSDFNSDRQQSNR